MDNLNLSIKLFQQTILKGLIMICSHLKTKPKLISWAAKSRSGHHHGFRVGLFCVACGKEVKP